MSPPPSLSTVEIDYLSDNAVLFSYNQPKISNAFTLQQYHDLREALLWALAEPKINVVVQYAQHLGLVPRSDTDGLADVAKANITAQAKSSSHQTKAVQPSNKRSKLAAS